jgi:YHS domain-containing protein
MHPDSNTAYAQGFMQSVEHPVCPVCGMDPSMSLKSEYRGKTYYFCTAAHKQNFDNAPERYITG